MTPAVRCAHTDLLDTAALVAHPRNPNQHGPEQIRMLGKIIAYQGWRNPIVVSKRSGYVIKGHGRLMAAISRGWESVPVDVQDYESEAQEYADLVADNRIAELAEIDKDTLRAIAQDQDGDTDFELFGFNEDAKRELFANPDDELISKNDDAEPRVDEQYMVLIKCRDEREQSQLLERFDSEGLDCKALIS